MLYMLDDAKFSFIVVNIPLHYHCNNRIVNYHREHFQYRPTLQVREKLMLHENYKVCFNRDDHHKVTLAQIIMATVLLEYINL